jgi:hypothetical protein
VCKVRDQLAVMTGQTAPDAFLRFSNRDPACDKGCKFQDLYITPTHSFGLSHSAINMLLVLLMVNRICGRKS